MKKILALALAAIMLFALCACGGNTNTTDPSTPSGETKEGPVKVVDIKLTEEEYAFGVDKDQPELLEKVNAFIAKIMEDGTFDEICNHYFGDGEPAKVESATLDTSKDQLVVATNAGFEPFEFKIGNSFSGIDMEIAKLLADDLGIELVVSDMDFDAVCLSVGQHKCDIAMAGLTVKEDRKEFVNFSDSYYQASQKVIVKSDDTTFDSCKDAQAIIDIIKGFDSSVKVGYQNGTTGSMFVTNQEDYAENGFQVTGKGYKNGSLAVQDLINGNISYVIIDEAPAECIVNSINEVAA